MSGNKLGGEINKIDFAIGVGLAVGSTIFIGASFIIKKKALLNSSRNGSVRASAGGFSYLKEWMWWAGLITMGIGEASNFAAYAFAPASVVTPLGALSVLVAAVLSTKFLHERLNLLGKVGCFLCILGSTIIVIHAPKEEEIEHLDDLISKLQESGFIIYAVLIVSISLFVAVYLGPRYGSVNVLVYVTVCSSVGSLTVMACKGLGLSIRETIKGQNDMTNWLTWIFLVMVIVCVVVQMTYLNKALDSFNTGIVTPVYYVMFTTLVLIASAILFKEWQNLDATDILGNICGFTVIVIAVMLLNSFKEVDISFQDMRVVWRCRRDHIKYTVEAEEESGQIKQIGPRQSTYDP
ncbi:magnesium transporter NIPA2 isoform X1 [Planococcus citri]|uniref:magnesium transporter NIPA2 isoform X1 n=1 Tax=Planococcus citri TaxID=170843 RepID=UPI0031F7B566